MEFDKGSRLELHDDSSEGENKAKIRRLVTETMSSENESVPTVGNASVPSLLDGELFKILTRKADGSITVKCMLCPYPKIKPGTIRSTGNFICHIKKCHPDKVERMKEKRRVRRVQQVKTPHAEKILPQEIHAYSLAEQEPTGNYVTQDEVDELTADFIADAMLPTSVADHVSFKTLILTLSRANITAISAPESESLRSILLRRYNFVIQTLRETLSAQQYLCTTAHIWTQGGINYLGMTVHYIERITLERKSLALAYRQLKSDFNIERRINATIHEVHTDHGIVDKVTHTLTDNSTEIARAFSRYIGLSLSIEPIKYEGRNGQDPIRTTENRYQEPMTSLEYTHLRRQKDRTSNSDEELAYLQKQHNCCCRTLSFVASVDAEPNNISDPLYQKTHSAAFSKTQALWSRLNRDSTAADTAQKVYRVSLPVPNPANWNTLHSAVSALLKHKDKINLVCTANRLDKFRHADFDFLNEWVTVMGPLAAALDVLQNEQMCFLGCVLPALYVLKKKLQGLEGMLIHCERLRKVVLKKIDERFSSILDLSSPESHGFILASISHPRFRTAWIPTQSLEVCKSLFFREFNKIQRNLSSNEYHSISSTPVKTNDDFFSSLDEYSEQRDIEYENTIHMRALSYLANPRKELALLHDFPVVMEMFLKYNTALPSSAAVERLLRVPGTAEKDRRNQLPDRTLELMLILKLNS